MWRCGNSRERARRWRLLLVESGQAREKSRDLQGSLTGPDGVFGPV
jgi:hypothetical protein